MICEGNGNTDSILQSDWGPTKAASWRGMFSNVSRLEEDLWQTTQKLRLRAKNNEKYNMKAGWASGQGELKHSY